MARIDSAYDYYVSNYVNKKVSRYDLHRQDDLRKISNRIIYANQEAPLYKITNPEAAKRQVIDLKEHARSLLNVVDSLADSYGTFEDSFRKKVATSSDEDKIGVTYIGDGTEDSRSDTFRVEIHQLAAPQINTGHYLPNDACSIPPGAYSFDLDTTASAYEFQYNVSEGETNLDIMKKLTRLINISNLGITANILDDHAGSSALSLTSALTGLSSREDSLFSISSDGSSGSIEAMNILGIDQVSQKAHNSSFGINGVSHESLSNTFTINNIFELRLRDTTDDAVVTIGFKSNSDAVADNLQTLVDAYNDTLHTAEGTDGDAARTGHTAEDTGDDTVRTSHKAVSSRLYRDIAALSRDQKLALEKAGLHVLDDASLSIDREVLSAAVSPERAADTFETLSAFRDAIADQAQSISINPINYVNKTIIAYKNPGHNFATPYISSLFSGMLLDEYV